MQHGTTRGILCACAAPTKEKVLDKKKKLEGGKVTNIEPMLCRVAGGLFYNDSKYTPPRPFAEIEADLKK